MPNEPTPVANELVLRCQWEAYMKCVLSENAYNLIGEGFTTFPESKNPKEYTRKYINHKTETTDVIGYSPSVEYSCDCISDDPVVKEMVHIHENELLGNAARRDIISVNRWEQDDNGKCTAYMRTYAVIPNTKGDGTDALVYSGTLKACTDQIKGKFDPATKEFVPDSEAG